MALAAQSATKHLPYREGVRWPLNPAKPPGSGNASGPTAWTLRWHWLHHAQAFLKPAGPLTTELAGFGNGDCERLDGIGKTSWARADVYLKRVACPSTLRVAKTLGIEADLAFRCFRPEQIQQCWAHLSGIISLDASAVDETLHIVR